MLIDANLLIYAVDSTSRFNAAASSWLEATLNGERRVALPWQTIGAFVRISTHHRITTQPLSSAQAWGFVRAWLDADPVWVPPATKRTAQVLVAMANTMDIAANLVPDAQLAALAIEHGLELLSADTDFARFAGLRWRNPLL